MKKLTLSLLAVLTFSVAAIAQKTKIVIETEHGKIVMALYDGTPKHRDNMTKLANEHFFDSLLFHRCIPQFVIQGGDPNSKNAKPGDMLGNGEHGPRIPAEIDTQYYHKRGAVGMARDGNPEKASSGCQFYIVTGKKYSDEELNNLEAHNKQPGGTNRVFSAAQREVYKTQGGTAMLDGGYTIYGEVIEGMDVAEKIAALPRNNADRPNVDVHMLKVYVQKKKKKFLFF